MNQNPKTYLKTFMFKGKKYPIYSVVELNNQGRKALYTDLKYVQICSSSYFNNKPDVIYWDYYTGANVYPSGYIWLHSRWTKCQPDEIIERVVMEAPLPGVMEDIQNKREAGYWHADIVFEWIKCVCICLACLIFADLMFVAFLWLCAFWYYYIKCNKLHNTHIANSFNTYSNKYHITQQMAYELYVHPDNKVKTMEQ